MSRTVKKVLVVAVGCMLFGAAQAFRQELTTMATRAAAGALAGAILAVTFMMAGKVGHE